MNSKTNQFPKDWEIQEIKDCDIEIIDGDRGKKYPNKQEFSNFGFCLFLNTGNIKDDKFTFNQCDFISEDKDHQLRKGKLQREDIVLTTRGTVGSLAYYHQGIAIENMRINSGMIILRCGSEINSQFLYQLLKSQTMKEQYMLYSSGAAQPQLPIRDFNRIKLVLPPLTQQEQIATVLSAYDDLIETNNQRIATLEQLAQQVYKEWFVRMRFPGWENTPSHHGVPEGWRIENFDKFCLLQRGFDLPDQEIKNGIHPVMASTSIKAFHNTYKVEPPVITTGRSGSLGTVLFSHQKAWPLNTALFVKNFYGNSPYLVFYTLKSLKLESFNAGAGVPSLNRNHLRVIKIKVPSKEIQNQFDKIISGIFNQKVVLEEANSILEKTRNLLLPRLISGKLSIKQAEALTP